MCAPFLVSEVLLVFGECFPYCPSSPVFCFRFVVRFRDPWRSGSERSLPRSCVSLAWAVMASSNKGGQRRIYIKVRDGDSVPYYPTENDVVGDLITMVYNQEGLVNAVHRGKLKIYQSEGSEQAHSPPHMFVWLHTLAFASLFRVVALCRNPEPSV